MHTHSHTDRSLGVQNCAANFADCDNCDNTDLFSLNQQRLCRERGDTELVRAMSRGTLECIRDCQRQFSGQKWNCTTFQGDYLFGRFTEDGMCVCSASLPPSLPPSLPACLPSSLPPCLPACLPPSLLHKFQLFNLSHIHTYTHTHTHTLTLSHSLTHSLPSPQVHERPPCSTPS